MFPCKRYQAFPATRRDMLVRCANGFGGLALLGLAHEEMVEAANNVSRDRRQYPAKVKSIIFLYMDGGPSQVDTFDPKPRLARENGQPIKMKVPPTQFDNVGTVMQSPWKFHQYGESGTPVSDLFPNVAECVDDLAIVRSMVSNFSEHTNANYFLHTGSGLQGRPSMGAWISYGLGSECRNLPGFVVLNGGLIPPGGLDNFNTGFLPASYQGSVFKTPAGVANITPTEKSQAIQRNKLDLLRQLDQGIVNKIGRQDAIESAIRNYELAFRMQVAVPDLMDLSREPASIHKLYGTDDSYAPTKTFATECLLARRLVERGVRFVELTCPSVGADRWDQHGNLKTGHQNNARAVDRPIAGLLKDLKSRGLLDQTLVVWGGEFGRTPMAQGSNGRDHNPFGFTIWLAGGGIRGGTIYGSTDDYGYYAIENRVEIHDLHATMLHLLGIDHTQLTFRFSGRDMRLTDVHGKILWPILA